MTNRATSENLRQRQEMQREKMGDAWAGHPSKGVKRKTPFPEGAFIRWARGAEAPTDGGLYLVHFMEPGSSHPRLVAASRVGYTWTFYGGDGTLKRLPPKSMVLGVAALGALFVAEGR